MGKLLAVGTTVLLIIGAGCRPDADEQVDLPRAVTVVTLEHADPGRQLRLTGSAASWKQEDVGFEVPGRVEWVIEPGVDVEGRSYDERGEVLNEGTVVARLQPRRYEVRLASARARMRAAEAQVESLRIKMEAVLPEQQRAAAAEAERARKDLERMSTLQAQGTGSQSELDRAETEHQSLRARVAELAAEQDRLLPELEAGRARVDEEQQEVNAAAIDLANCTLVSPFRCRVAEVHCIPGAFVQPGTPVVTLIVMDPLKVEVAVSPALDREIHEGGPVLIFPPGLETPELGWVYHKDTVADPATRTFRLTLMVRNRKVPVSGEMPPPGLSRIEELWNLEPDLSTDPVSLCVEVESLHQDEAGFYVWKAEGLDFATLRTDAQPLLTMRKVRVQPGDRRVSVLGIYTFRELTDTGGLTQEDPIARKAPEGLTDGGAAVLLRERWLFRPGDMVPVQLDLQGPGPGLYLPMEAIRVEGGQRFVFTVGQEGASQVALRRPVESTGGVGELRLVQGEGLEAGVQVILEGAHYLDGGEQIRVIGTRRIEE